MLRFFKKISSLTKGSTSTQQNTLCNQFTDIKNEFRRELDAVNDSARKCAGENQELKNEICKLKCNLDNAKANRDRAEKEKEEIIKQLENEQNGQKKDREKWCKENAEKDDNIQTELHIGYESKVNKSINELRNQFKDKMCIAGGDLMKEINDSYKFMALPWDTDVEIERGDIDRKIEGNFKIISDLQVQLTKCSTIRDKLTISVDQHKRKHDKNVNEIRRMQQELILLLNQYQDLIDTKLLLDFELAAYNQMLVIEEYRLNVMDMCQTDPPASQSTKRKASTSSAANDSKREK